MNEDWFRALIEDHARFPAALLAVFQGADEQLLRDRETEKKWSPLEILAHLRDEEKLDFRVRAQCAIDGREPELNVDPEKWVTERNYNAMDPGEVYLDFAAERADSCRWLSSLSMADLEPALEHPAAGTMRAGDFIAAWRLHDLLHLRQFAHAMAVNTSRRLSDWKTAYAGEL
ncbi:DinB family protein [bacterium]|nr:DinB family protein [bacterium]